MSDMTVQNTAEAVNAIYENDDFDGFTLKGGFFDPKNDDRLGWQKEGDAGGGSAGLYQSDGNQAQYILAFRGSMGSKDWTVDDAQITFGYTVDRANDVIKYTKSIQYQYPNALVLIVGHSLGGFLAQVVGVVCDLPFITYNAPPASNAASRFPGGSDVVKFKKGVNLRIGWDPVSLVPGSHVGPVIMLPHLGWNLANAHTIGAITRSMAQFDQKDASAMAYITSCNH